MFWGVWFLFCNEVPSVLSGFENHLAEEERVGCFTLCSCYCVAVSDPCLFPVVPWVGLCSVSVAFPSYTRLFFHPWPHPRGLGCVS